MINYAVLEINGKQYKIKPEEPILVDQIKDAKDGASYEAKVLLMSEDGKVRIGNPYLKEKLKLKIEGTKKLPKIRVSKFHAKANYRKTNGIRPIKTSVLLTI